MTNDTPPERTAVWGNYTQSELNAQYDQSTLVKNAQSYENEWRKGSDVANERLTVQKDLSYGESTGQTLDLFLPTGDGPFAVVMFFHGGAWTRHDKSKFAFPAPAFVEHDIAFVSVGFDRLPTVSLGEMTTQCRRAVDWLLDNAQNLNLDADALFVAGHSSGAHLAACALTLDSDAPPPDIKGALLLSGIYDLDPVRHSSRNEYLHLDDALVAALSPIAHIPHDPCPLVLACGGGELDEFKRQTKAFADAWEAGGGEVRLIDCPRHNHFSITAELADATGEAMQAFLELIEQRI